MFRALGFLSTVFLSSGALAHQTVIPFDSVDWLQFSELDRCTIELRDYKSGVDVTFLKRPRHDLSLTLTHKGVSFIGDDVSVSTVPAVWDGSRSSQVKLLKFERNSNRQLYTQHDVKSILSDLEAGNWLNVQTSMNDFVIPGIEFQSMMSSFRYCVDALPPIDFAQASRTRISFASGVTELTVTQKALIADIARLVLIDTDITSIMIDGHADSAGDSLENLLFSERRAFAVEDEFKKNGVDGTFIETRKHGARYPVASNNTAKGRQSNRRVEIRLLKSGEGATSD